MNPTPRTPSEGLARRLLAYPAWAAGGAMGLAGFEAEGAMVCMDLDLALTPGFREPVFFQLDINGDGQNEVGLGVGTASNPDMFGNNGMVQAGGIFGAQVAFTEPFPLGVPGAYYGGDAIGSGLGFSSAIGTLALSSAGPAGGIGAWWGGNDAYIGVMFDIGGATHYGWVHAVWDPSVNTLSIDRVGYENTGAAAVVPGPDPYPIDLDITVVPNAGPEGAAMDLRWQVEAGFTYELERSDDMNTWTTIRTVTPGLCGEESFVDTPPGESTGGPYYYRVKRSSTSLLWLALGLPGRRRRTQAGG